jgi:hypothetical protein
MFKNVKSTNVIIPAHNIAVIEPRETTDVVVPAHASNATTGIVRSQAEIEVRGQAADEANARAEQSDGAVAKLLQVYARFQDSLDTMEAAAIRLEVELRDANAKRLQAEERAKAAGSQLASASTKIDMLEAQLQIKKVELRNMSGELQNDLKAKTDLRECNFALKKSNADISRQLKQTMLELMDSEAVVRTLTQNSPEDLVVALEKEKELRQAEKKALIKEKKDISAALEKEKEIRETENKAAANQKKDLEYKLKASNKAKEAALLRHIELEDKARSARSEAADLKQANEDLETDNAVLTEKLEKLKMSAILPKQISTAVVSPEGLADLPFHNVTDTWLIALFDPRAHDKETGYGSTPRDEPLLARILRSDFDRLSSLIMAFVANFNVDGCDSRYLCTMAQGQQFHRCILDALDQAKQLLVQNASQAQENDALQASRVELESSNADLALPMCTLTSTDGDVVKETSNNMESTILNSPQADGCTSFNASHDDANDHNITEHAAPVFKFGGSSVVTAFNVESTIPQDTARPVSDFTFNLSEVTPLNSTLTSAESAFEESSHTPATTEMVTFCEQDINNQSQDAPQETVEREVLFDFASMTSSPPAGGVFRFGAGGFEHTQALFSSSITSVEATAGPTDAQDESSDESVLGAQLPSSSSPIVQAHSPEDAEGEVTSLTSLASDDEQMQEDENSDESITDMQFSSSLSPTAPSTPTSPTAITEIGHCGVTSLKLPANKNEQAQKESSKKKKQKGGKGKRLTSKQRAARDWYMGKK